MNGVVTQTSGARPACPQAGTGSDRGTAEHARKLLEATGASAIDCLRRSAVFSRMADGTLPFVGRAAYLEQHWEGLRVLRQALAATGGAGEVPVLAPVRAALASTADQLAVTLDRAHATARWRDCHVTMPSMLQFRRHVSELQDSDDRLGLVAHTCLRLLLAEVCPASVTGNGLRPLTEALGVFITDEEDLERLSEEFSVALLLIMQHGSDVCRGYPEQDAERTCAGTVSTIRRALR